jgi:hypothetical protein
MACLAIWFASLIPCWDDPSAEKTAAPASEAKAETLDRYEELRQKTPRTVSAHWKLGLWCQEHGLPVEASVHFGAVVRLDPTRAEAWKRLGYKKHDGRWMTDEQIVEEERRKLAERTWLPRLKKWHKDIHGGKKQAEALAAIGKIEDPDAVSSVYREFAGGGAADQKIAIQILGQIRSPVASKVLALLSIYGKSPEVRRAATETLRGRDPNEFLDLLVGLLADPLKYQVRPVGGPGSPGVIFVEGERFNVRLFYAPPPAPNIAPRPGDMISYDGNGLPVIIRPFGTEWKAGVPGSKTLAYDTRAAARISLSDNIMAAQQGAVAAQAQLEGDIAAIESLNKARRDFNDVVLNVVRDSTGKDIGTKRDDWNAALTGPREYAKKAAPQKPTVDQVVALAYQPAVNPQLSFVTRITTDS